MVKQEAELSLVDIQLEYKLELNKERLEETLATGVYKSNLNILKFNCYYELYDWIHQLMKST